MKRMLFCLFFLIFCIPSFSLNFGFEINQETVFSEKTEYTPSFFDNTQTDVFVNFSHTTKNCLLAIYPNLCFKDENLYFNIYKCKFNLFFDNFAFFIGKDIFYYGNGTFENLSTPQSITIRDKDENFWYTKCDLFFMGQTISLGALLDKKIDYYESLTYFNPFVTVNLNSTYFNLIYSIDYLLSENDSLKNSLEINFLSAKDLSLYSTLSYISDLSEENNLKSNIGISQAYIFKDFIISPLCEFNYSFTNNNLGLLFNLHSEFYDFLNLETGISYSNSDTNTLNLRIKIDFYLKSSSIQILYQSQNLLKEEQMNKGYLSVGVKYEI